MSGGAVIALLEGEFTILGGESIAGGIYTGAFVGDGMGLKSGLAENKIEFRNQIKILIR